MQEVRAEERRAAALALFQDGKFEDAAREFRAELDAHENSEAWNDWAAAETMCGRIEAAIAGFTRALQLDAANTQAKENLLVLREQCLKAITAAQDTGQVLDSSVVSDAHPAWAPEHVEEAVVQWFVNALAQIPLCDPTLPVWLRDALEKSGTDSSHVVREAYRLFTLLEEGAKQRVLEWLEQAGEANYRLRLIAALAAFEIPDWPHVLRLVRAAGDQRPEDLYVERVRMHAEEKWHEADESHVNAFAGLDEYLKRSFCTVPWENLEIGSWGEEIEKTGNAYLCCPGQLPFSVGNVRERPAEEVWNSDAAQEVRRAILDGSFRFCSHIHCPLIGGRHLPTREEVLAKARAKAGNLDAGLEELYPARADHGPEELHLSYDRSCNLSCPSCRSAKYTATPERQGEMEAAFGNMVRRLAKRARAVYLDGAGEALASKHSRILLKSLTRADFPHLKLHLISNGQLLDRRAWEEFDLRGRVEWIFLSMDGAREETYRITRRGGTLERFLANLSFLDELRQKQGEKFGITIQYVVSALTFREMPEAVRLLRRYHVDRLVFIAFRNWGHMPKAESRKWIVTNPEHPDHEEFVRVLHDPELRDAMVDLGSVMDARNGAALRQAHNKRASED